MEIRNSARPSWRDHAPEPAPRAPSAPTSAPSWRDVAPPERPPRVDPRSGRPVDDDETLLEQIGRSFSTGRDAANASLYGLGGQALRAISRDGSLATRAGDWALRQAERHQGRIADRPIGRETVLNRLLREQNEQAARERIAAEPRPEMPLNYPGGMGGTAGLGRDPAVRGFVDTAAEAPGQTARAVLGDVVQSLPEMLVGMGATAAGGPLGGAAYYGATGAGRQLNDAATDPETGRLTREVGPRAGAAAVVSGVAGGAVEMLADKVLIGRVSRGLRRAGVPAREARTAAREFGRRLVDVGRGIERQGRTEAATEAVQTAIENLGARYGWDPSREISEGMVDAVVTGYASGLLFGAGGEAVTGAARLLPSTQRDAAPDARPTAPTDEPLAPDATPTGATPSPTTLPAAPAGAAPEAGAVPDPGTGRALTAGRPLTDDDFQQAAGLYRQRTGQDLPDTPQTRRMVAQNLGLSVEAAPDPYPVDVRPPRGDSITITAGRATNEVTGEGEAGRLVSTLRPDALRITNVGVNDAQRGEGYGTRMYEAAAAEAARRGLALESDVEVTTDAARVWDALGRRGHTIERHPEAQLEAVDGVEKWTAPGPVFRIADPSTATAPATRPATAPATRPEQTPEGEAAAARVLDPGPTYEAPALPPRDEGQTSREYVEANRQALAVAVDAEVDAVAQRDAIADDYDAALIAAAETSENPVLLAEAWQAAQRQREGAADSSTSVDALIAEEIGLLDRRDLGSYAEDGGVGTQTAYFRSSAYDGQTTSDGAASTRQVESVPEFAQRLTEERGVTVTPEDVADFIRRHPNGPQQVTSGATQARSAIEQRLREVTGQPVTAQTVEQLLGAQPAADRGGPDPDVPFSRSEARVDQGAPAGDVEAVLEGTAFEGRVSVVQSEADLPQRLRAQVRRSGAVGRVRGLFSGSAYIVANNIPVGPDGRVDRAAVLEVAAHEVVGHGGLRALVGKELDRILDAIARDMSADPEFQRIAAKYRADLETEKGRRLAAEEYVAHLAGRHVPAGTMPGPLRRVVRRVLRWLRANMGGREWTEADVVALVAEAAQESAAAPVQGTTRYALAYHGTPNGRFDGWEGDDYRQNPEDPGYYGEGVYFSDDRTAAEFYAEGGGYAEDPYVFEGDLEFDNPLEIDDLTPQAFADSVRDLPGVPADAIKGAEGGDPDYRWYMYEGDPRGLVGLAERAGYDGVIVRNAEGNPGRTDYVALDWSQFSEGVSARFSLDDDAVAMRASAEADRVLSDPAARARAWAWYRRVEESDAGRIVDTDLWREHFDDYNADPAANGARVHEAAKRLANAFYEDALAALPPGSTVAFTGGGPGSGKSAARSSYQGADLVRDGVAADFGKQRRRMDAVEAGGHAVYHVYVYASAEEAGWRALNRAANPRWNPNGRPVPMGYLADAHAGALETALALHAAGYNVRFVNNDGPPGSEHPLTADDVQGLRYPSTDDALTQALAGLDRALADLRAAGVAVDPGLLAGFRSDLPAEADSGGDPRGGQSGGRPGDARNPRDSPRGEGGPDVDDGARFSLGDVPASGLGFDPDALREALLGAAPLDGAGLSGEPVALTQAETRAMRQRLGLGAMDAPQRRHWEDVVRQVLDRRLHEGAEGLLARFYDENGKARAGAAPLADIEHAAIAVALSKHVAAHAELEAEAETAERAGDEGLARSLQAMALGHLATIDRITEGVDLAGTAWGRAGAIRRMQLKRDDADALEVTRALSVARRMKGDKLTPSERSKIAEAVQRAQAAVRKATMLENRLRETEQRLARQVAAAARKESLGYDPDALAKALSGEPDPPPTPKQRAQKDGRGDRDATREKRRATIRAERADLKAQLARTLGQLNAGLDPKALKLVGQLALNYAKEASLTLEQLIGLVRADFPGLSEEDVIVAIATPKSGPNAPGAPSRTEEEYERAKLERRRAISAVRIAQRALKERSARDKTLEALETPRALMATGDLSATLRQGGVLVSRRPKQASKAFATALDALRSDDRAETIDIALRESEHFELAEMAQLYISPVGDEAKIAHAINREEDFAAQAIKKVPGLGAVVGASERHYTTFLNVMRMEAFSQFVEAYPDATMDDLRAWADFVNKASGRGDLGSFSSAARALSLGLFSARFTVSRWQTLTALLKHRKRPSVRAEIMKDLGAFIAVRQAALALGGLALGALAGDAGDEDEPVWRRPFTGEVSVGMDPTSSDWGKLVAGDFHLDVWAGVQQPVRAVLKVGLLPMSRYAPGAVEALGMDAEQSAPGYDNGVVDIAAGFFGYKLSPQVGAAIALMEGQNAIGEEQGPGETLLRSVIPLTAQEPADVLIGDGGTVAGALLVLGATTIGLGASVYDAPMRSGVTASAMRRADYLPAAGSSKAVERLNDEEREAYKSAWERAFSARVQALDPAVRGGDTRRLRSALEREAKAARRTALNEVRTGA